MATISDAAAYMIDGVEIPAYPTSVSPSHNLVSKSWNDMFGQFKDIPINSKLKINWVFDYITDEDLTILWRNMIYNKLINQKTRFFEINTAFPGLGFIKGTFYLGTPTNFQSKDWQSNSGRANWYQCELHWIEVDGIVLNSPAEMPPHTIKVNGKQIYLENVSKELGIDG